MDHFLTPMLALIIWTLLVLVVMMAIRVPLMMKITPDAQNFIRDPSLFEQLPKVAIWSGNNHNHLHEQPTLFYALMVYLYLTETTPEWMLSAAWAYVAVRIVHSFVQTFINHLLARFTVYSVATGILIAMCVGAVQAL